MPKPLSWRKLLKRFRDKLIEFSENPICWDALKAGRDFESEKDGKRAERVLEKGAREKLKEMNQLEKEMDEWSPFDDVEEGRAASKRLELEPGRVSRLTATMMGRRFDSVY